VADGARASAAKTPGKAASKRRSAGRVLPEAGPLSQPASRQAAALNKSASRGPACAPAVAADVPIQPPSAAHQAVISHAAASEATAPAPAAAASPQGPEQLLASILAAPDLESLEVLLEQALAGGGAAVATAHLVALWLRLPVVLDAAPFGQTEAAQVGAPTPLFAVHGLVHVPAAGRPSCVVHASSHQAAQVGALSCPCQDRWLSQPRPSV
jgi:hypothetical protein